MVLLQLQQVTLRYGKDALLDKADFRIDDGEKVCLLGRNGCGKTSLMRLLRGDEMPQEGTVVRAGGLAVTILDQEIPETIAGEVREVLKGGIPEGRHIEDWEWDRRVEEVGTAMGIPLDAAFETLSGGLKRRVLLARALAGEPDLLLLDEPTNHLDVETILWLERHLKAFRGAILFVTHDRALVRSLATRIIEIDRGKLSSWECNYELFLERRAAALESEEKERALFDKKLAQEEAWIRQGIKARRTRNEGRVRALEALRVTRQARREREKVARMEISDSANSGQKVVDLREVTFSYGMTPVFRDLTTTVWRGDKIGIIGPNGSGKTTLLKVMLGALETEVGSVKLGTNLQIAYLDQMRAQIDPAKTVAQNVAGSAESVTFNGRSRHIHSYLQDFLFASEQIRMPSRMLSGGERNRLLLARLFLQPANLLVLDEPTNDLDAETLELLESLLVEYEGTILLVSHDREFLDNVVSSTLAFEGDGFVRESIGGFSDWMKNRAIAEKRGDSTKKGEAPQGGARQVRPQKFLNKERRELESLPKIIEELEKKKDAISVQLWDPAVYQQSSVKVPELKEDLERTEEEIIKSFSRWEELDKKRRECEGESALA